MPPVVTDAIVLHAADYLESSRLVRLVTRQHGVQSAVARGARNSRKRFGSALDLFAEGQAHLDWRPGRDLQALTGFDAVRIRPALAADLGRFAAASALAECVLRLMHDEVAPQGYDRVAAGLEAIAGAAPPAVNEAALGAVWRVVSAAGFAPAVDHCAECGAALDPAMACRFHHGVGGCLCEGCGRHLPGGRLLPPPARDAVRRWVDWGGDHPGRPIPADPVALTEIEAKAHQRLLREFVATHAPDNRPLKAWTAWEQEAWTAT
ncbi:MAG: DNA repair protein RecO [Gemmatimonadetes bacterium]|nr:DNA repair protein RecO [Gemmatimonadota bacterium]